MRKFNISVNGKSYEVDVEEVGGVSTPAPAPVQTAAPARGSPARPFRRRGGAGCGRWCASPAV